MEETSIRDLYEKYENTLLKYARHLMNQFGVVDEAEDLVQDAFIDFMDIGERLPDFDHEKGSLYYLRKILMNNLIYSSKKKSKHFGYHDSLKTIQNEMMIDMMKPSWDPELREILFYLVEKIIFNKLFDKYCENINITNEDWEEIFDVSLELLWFFVNTIVQEELFHLDKKLDMKILKKETNKSNLKIFEYIKSCLIGSQGKHGLKEFGEMLSEEKEKLHNIIRLLGERDNSDRWQLLNENQLMRISLINYINDLQGARLENFQIYLIRKYLGWKFEKIRKVLAINSYRVNNAVANVERDFFEFLTK